MENITQARLKELLHYDPETGVFTRIKTTSSRAIAGMVAGCLGNHGYLVIRLDYKLYLAHRLSWLYMTGEWPTAQIDHDDHVRTNNAWGNFASVDNQNNHRNMSLSKRNTSGATGVTWSKRRQRWIAQIKVSYRNICLGQFESKADAIAARKAADTQYGFHPNHGAT